MIDGGLRQIFRANLPQVDWTTVEIHLASNGVPDLNGCFTGTEIWLEMKATAHWRITVRPAQIGWAERRIAHGGRVFAAVRRAETELWLFSGSDLRRLKTERLDSVPRLGRWFGGPAKWAWPEISRILLEK
jgi:hypothetical protein